MTIELSFVFVTLIICVTVLVWKGVDAYTEHRVNKAEKAADYWRAKYNALAKAFDKALDIRLSEEYLDAVAEFVKKLDRE